MMNTLEQCYELQFETRTWYFEQLAILDSKYSHYIETILQHRVSIKSKLEKEYKQRLQNIDEKLQSLTNNSKNDDGISSISIKQELMDDLLIANDNNQLLHIKDDSISASLDMHESINKLTGINEQDTLLLDDQPNGGNGCKPSFQTGIKTNADDHLETGSKPKPKTTAKTKASKFEKEMKQKSQLRTKSKRYKPVMKNGTRKYK